MQIGERRSEFASRKDKLHDGYQYNWLGKDKNIRRKSLNDASEYGDEHDATEYGDEYVYDYREYYENNIDYEKYPRDRDSDFNYPRSGVNEEDFGSRDEQVKRKMSQPRKNAKQHDHGKLLTTLPPLTLDFKFSNKRLKVMKARSDKNIEIRANRNKLGLQLGLAQDKLNLDCD